MKYLTSGLMSLALAGILILPSVSQAQYGCGHGGGFGPIYRPIYQPSCGSYYGSFYSQCSYLPCTYNRWSNYCWFNQYNCCGYYCPQRCQWFYYYQPRNCFLPVSYMNQYQPAPFNFNQNQNLNQNTNINQNININGNPLGGVAGLPVGAVGLPNGVNPNIPVMPRIP